MLTLKERQNIHIIHVYERTNHNISLSAKILKVGRTYLHERLNELLPDVETIEESEFIEFNI